MLRSALVLAVALAVPAAAAPRASPVAGAPVARAPIARTGHAVTAAVVSPRPPPREITSGQWEADIAMRLGEHAYLGGDMPAALAAFQAALAKDPSRVEALWRMSHCLVVMERIPEAIVLLERARKLAPDDARILNTFAVVRLRAGQAADATALARKAVSHAPGVADVWDTLGQAYLKAHDKIRARTAFESALRLDPKHEQAQRGLSQCAP